ncbi:MAG: patatin-like phospholipase family protein [Candidatus Coproplasma sp.]
MSKKLGVALGSGGARGAAHIGFLKALEEEGIKPDFISGCSMGSVVGACYSKGMPVDRMAEVALSLKSTDIMDISAAPITKLGLLRGNKIQKLLLNYIGDVTFDNLNIPFACVATDLRSGRQVTLNSGSVASAVRASSAIPTIFRPVELDGMLLCDGGVLCRVPVRQVKEMGADVVVAFDVLANTGESVEKVPNIIMNVLRVFDIMDYNQNQMLRILNKDCYDLWLAPEMKGLNQYNVKDVEQAYTQGYAYSKEHVEEIKALLESD